MLVEENYLSRGQDAAANPIKEEAQLKVGAPRALDCTALHCIALHCTPRNLMRWLLLVFCPLARPATRNWATFGSQLLPELRFGKLGPKKSFGSLQLSVGHIADPVVMTLWWLLFPFWRPPVFFLIQDLISIGGCPMLNHWNAEPYWHYQWATPGRTRRGGACEQNQQVFSQSKVFLGALIFQVQSFF